MCRADDFPPYPDPQNHMSEAELIRGYGGLMPAATEGPAERPDAAEVAGTAVGELPPPALRLEAPIG